MYLSVSYGTNWIILDIFSPPVPNSTEPIYSPKDESVNCNAESVKGAIRAPPKYSLVSCILEPDIYTSIRAPRIDAFAGLIDPVVTALDQNDNWYSVFAYSTGTYVSSKLNFTWELTDPILFLLVKLTDSPEISLSNFAWLLESTSQYLLINPWSVNTPIGVSFTPICIEGVFDDVSDNISFISSIVCPASI